jgi:hypothetical protein
MYEKIKQFEVSSPDELRSALASYEQNGAYFAGVRVFGPNVLTRQFNFPNSSEKDLVAGLKMEASETLSVSADDLELSYQITTVDEKGIHGIYSVMTRHVLMDYLECFKDHSLIPVSLTASAVGAVIDFLNNQRQAGDNFCLVNFLNPRVVNIIIFADGKPTFFRELYDLSDSDFKDKITDTIRYSCSQSASKRIDQMYFIGDLNGKDDLIKSLKEMKYLSSGQPVSAGGAATIDLMGLNLLGKLVCAPEEQKKLVFIFNLISVFSAILCIFMVWHFVSGLIHLHDAGYKVNISAYNHALDLQEQVRRLSHG